MQGGQQLVLHNFKGTWKGKKPIEVFQDLGRPDSAENLPKLDSSIVDHVEPNCDLRRHHVQMFV